jgi:hypothetical protein
MLKFAMLLGVLGGVGIAAPICTDVVSNAADFQAQGGTGCQFGDKVFYDFTYSYVIQDTNGTILPNGDGGTPPVPGSAVTVTFNFAGGNPTRPVVSFIGPWLVQGGDSGDVRIGYSVWTTPSGAIFEASLTLTGVLSNVAPNVLFPPYVNGGETVKNPAPGNGALQLTATLAPPPGFSGGTVVTATDSSSTHPAANNFAGAFTQLSFTKDIFISSGDAGNFALLSQIDEGLSEVAPEPLSFVLFGGGLVGLGLLGARKRKAAK